MSDRLNPSVAQVLPTVQEAVAASVAVGRRLGLPVADPVVLADGYSVRVQLAPAPVVTRVPTRGGVLRPGPLPWLTRELAVATWLADRGAPVVGPSREVDPGPHRGAGLDLTLWTFTSRDPDAEVDQRSLGSFVGDLHHVLAGYPGELPVLVGPATDVASAVRLVQAGAVEGPLAQLLVAAAKVLAPALAEPAGALQPLHGDVHTGNVFVTPEGLRWSDFEDTCRGPLEWDLASMTVTAEAVAAYPGRLDRQRCRLYRDVRRLQILANAISDEPWQPVQEQPWLPDLLAALRRRVSAVRRTVEQ